MSDTEFDKNMKVYIEEKFRLDSTNWNIDEKYKRKYASFIKEMEKKYNRKLAK